MKIIKALGIYAAAEIFCLFIGLTLAGSSSPVMRVICSICTVGILVVLLANFAVKEAHSDLKQERISGEKASHAKTAVSGITLSLPAIISWVLLMVSVSGGKFDFYRWYKLINAPFLQVCNLINANASSAALSMAQVCIMLPMVFVPAVTYLAVYFLTYRGIIFSEKEKI